MSGEASRAQFSVRLQRDYPASRNRVYQACTEPERFKQWFRPPGCVTLTSQFDLRVEGRLMIVLWNESTAARQPIQGVFRAVDPPRRLQFTWTLAGPGGTSCETLVTVDFQDRGESTRLLLRHEYLPGPEATQRQEAALNKCLDQLAGYLGI